MVRVSSRKPPAERGSHTGHALPTEQSQTKGACACDQSTARRSTDSDTASTHARDCPRFDGQTRAEWVLTRLDWIADTTGWLSGLFLPLTDWFTGHAIVAGLVLLPAFFLLAGVLTVLFPVLGASEQLGGAVAAAVVLGGVLGRRRRELPALSTAVKTVCRARCVSL